MKTPQQSLAIEQSVRLQLKTPEGRNRVRDRMWRMTSGPTRRQLEALITEVEQQHYGVTVDLSALPFAQAYRELATLPWQYRGKVHNPQLAVIDLSDRRPIRPSMTSSTEYGTIPITGQSGTPPPVDPSA